MDRRQFLQVAGAALAGPLMVPHASAQAPVPTGPFVFAPITRRLTLDAHSRALQWVRSADEVAKAAIEMTCGGVCLTVGSHPAHVDMSRLGRELPAFAARVRSHGVQVRQLTGPTLRDISDRDAETLTAAVADAGCTHYSVAGDTYDLSKPLAPQLDALRVRLARFVRLNEKHKLTLVYEPATGAAAIGAVVLDLLPVIGTFDSRFIGLGWDTGHMALHADGAWETLLRFAGAYVATVLWRDRGWVQDLGLRGEGGPYAGPYPRVEPLVTLPDGRAVPGTPPAGTGRGGRGGGRGGVAPSDEGEIPVPAGRGTPRGPANSAGAGSIDDANPLWRSVDGRMPKRPIGGLNAKGAGWSAPNVAMGTGVVHLPRVATVLTEIGFNGPTSLRSEYAGIGGAEAGRDRIDRDRQFVIGMLKRDVLTIRKSFEMANVGVAI